MESVPTVNSKTLENEARSRRDSANVAVALRCSAAASLSESRHARALAG